MWWGLSIFFLFHVQYNILCCKEIALCYLHMGEIFFHTAYRILLSSMIVVLLYTFDNNSYILFFDDNAAQMP